VVPGRKRPRWPRPEVEIPRQGKLYDLGKVHRLWASRMMPRLNGAIRVWKPQRRGPCRPTNGLSVYARKFLKLSVRKSLPAPRNPGYTIVNRYLLVGQAGDGCVRGVRVWTKNHGCAVLRDVTQDELAKISCKHPLAGAEGKQWRMG